MMEIRELMAAQVRYPNVGRVVLGTETGETEFLDAVGWRPLVGTRLGAALVPPIVVDRDGVQRDMAWVESVWGVQLLRAEVAAGAEVVYVVAALYEQEGDATQKVRILDPQGQAVGGVEVVRYWPDAPVLPEYGPPASRWFGRGVHGKTNANGDIGYGVGPGDWFGYAGGGVSAVWVADVLGPSDCVNKLGWLGNRDGENTAHLMLNVVYRRERVEQEPEPPEPPEPPVDGVSAAIDRLTAEVHVLATVAGLERRFVVVE